MVFMGLVCWLAGWSGGWLAGWLAGQVFGWFVCLFIVCAYIYIGYIEE